MPSPSVVDHVDEIVGIPDVGVVVAAPVLVEPVGKGRGLKDKTVVGFPSPLTLLENGTAEPGRGVLLNVLVDVARNGEEIDATGLALAVGLMSPAAPSDGRPRLSEACTSGGITVEVGVTCPSVDVGSEGRMTVVDTSLLDHPTVVSGNDKAVVEDVLVEAETCDEMGLEPVSVL